MTPRVPRAAATCDTSRWDRDGSVMTQVHWPCIISHLNNKFRCQQQNNEFVTRPTSPVTHSLVCDPAASLSGDTLYCSYSDHFQNRSFMFTGAIILVTWVISPHPAREVCSSFSSIPLFSTEAWNFSQWFCTKKTKKPADQQFKPRSLFRGTIFTLTLRDKQSQKASHSPPLAWQSWSSHSSKPRQCL